MSKKSKVYPACHECKYFKMSLSDRFFLTILYPFLWLFGKGENTRSTVILISQCTHPNSVYRLRTAYHLGHDHSTNIEYHSIAYMRSDTNIKTCGIKGGLFEPKKRKKNND